MQQQQQQTPWGKKPDYKRLMEKQDLAMKARIEPQVAKRDVVARKFVPHKNHQWGLINIANKGQRPMQDHPAVRFLGFFETKGAACAHARILQQHDPSCAIHLCGAGQMTLICETIQSQYTEGYVKAKSRAIVEATDRDIANRKREFETRKRKAAHDKNASAWTEREEEELRRQRPRKMTARDRAVRRIIEKRMEDSTFVNLKPVLKLSLQPSGSPREVRNIGGGHTLVGQTIVACTFLDDTTNVGPNEPIVVFWAAFADMEEATAWRDKYGRHYAVDVNLDFVDCYQWLYPTEIKQEDIANKTYRTDELGKIMNGAEKAKQQVDEFEKFCEENKIDVPVTELEATGPGQHRLVSEAGSNGTVSVRSRDTHPRDVVVEPARGFVVVDPRVADIGSNLKTLMEE